jgi:serine/threonine protein kinase
MENGSLSDWLCRKDCLEVQSWNYRIQIALDVANGLHYLHNFTDPICVHKRICSSNVLLNRHLRAKIANFSCAHSAKQEEYMNSSMRLALGEKGYMAPEYIEYGLVAPEIDVYAFGVVLLELVTGKEAVFIQDEEEMQLSEAIISIMEEGDGEAELGGLIDPCLMEKCSMKLVLRLVKLSLACLEQEPERRPSMGEIVSSLLKIQVDVQKSEPYLWRGGNF